MIAPQCSEMSNKFEMEMTTRRALHRVSYSGLESVVAQVAVRGQTAWESRTCGRLSTGPADGEGALVLLRSLLPPFAAQMTQNSDESPPGCA